jgi:four helix bundle protein
MATINRFEEIIAWQKSKDLAVLLYKTFGTSRDLGFRTQIQRAAVSISNNIAEGFERQTNKEFKNFLYIAKGSAGEVRSMLAIARELTYITTEQYEDFSLKTLEISKLLSGLIKTL